MGNITTFPDTRVPDPKPAQALALPGMNHPSKAMRAAFTLPIKKAKTKTKN